MEPSCPDPEQLQEFALGLNDAARFDIVAQHVEACADYQQRLEQLDGSIDELVGRLGKLQTAARVEPVGHDAWAQSVLDSRVAADAGRNLARRLLEGVVHRDVKPSNIILDREDHAHVMDFGLAKRDTGEATMTSDGRVLGTPAYMSPEQADGTSHQVDARSDIYSLGVYSLGVVLYEMLTGERPFHGNRRLLQLQVLEDDPRPPRAVKRDVPCDLEVICLKAMSKTPPRRYQTAHDMADDLRRFLQGQPVLARPMGYTEQAMRWCRRDPLAVSVLLAVVVWSVVGLWYLSSLSEFFVRPLDREIDNTHAGLRGAFLLMGLISSLLLVVSVAVIVMTQRRRKAGLER